MTKPDLSLDDAEREPGERPPRAKRKPSQPKYYIFRCTDGTKAGPRAERGSVPLDVDPETFIEESRHCEPGLYRIEKRKSGEFPKEVCYYTKEEILAGVGQAETEEGDEGDSDYELEDIAPSRGIDGAHIAKIVAATVNATLEARERRERAAQGQPTALDQTERIFEIIERRTDRVREEMRDQMKLLMARESPRREPELDDKTRLTLAFANEAKIIPTIFREWREIMGTAESVAEPQSWSDRLLELGRVAIESPYVGPIIAQAAAPAIAKLSQRMAAEQMTPQPQMPAVPVPPVPHRAPAGQVAQTPVIGNPNADLPLAPPPPREPAINGRPLEAGDSSTIEEMVKGAIPEAQAEVATGGEAVAEFNAELSEWFSFTIRDFAEGKGPGEAAREYLSLVEEFRESVPENVANLEKNMTMPPAILCQVIMSLAPSYAETLARPGAVEFITSLQTEIAAQRPVDITAFVSKRREATPDDKPNGGSETAQIA